MGIETLLKNNLKDIKYINADYTFNKVVETIEQVAIGFSDWQRTLVFTDKDIWLKEKTTKELYELYLETL